MPKKKLFTPQNLINVNIRRKDYEKILYYRRDSRDPFYLTLARVVNTFLAEKAEIELELKNREEQIFAWKQKYLDEIANKQVKLNLDG